MRIAKGMLLLFVLIAPVAITFSWLHLEKAQVRKAIKWRILNHTDRSELTLLRFSVKQTQSAINWKHEREFEWQEKMYDIVQYEKRGDSVYYWCLADEAETNINQKIATFIEDVWQQNQGKKEQEKRLETFFKSLFLAESETHVLTILPSVAFTQNAFYNELLRFGGRPPTPPPQG